MSSVLSKKLSSWLALPIFPKSLWQRLSVRFVLVLGVLIFFIAVGVDSLQNSASAAGMDVSAIALSSASAPQTTVVTGQAPFHATHTYLEYNPKTAHRLLHSGLTSASLTSSHLTSAYLFTDVAE